MSTEGGDGKGQRNVGLLVVVLVLVGVSWRIRNRTVVDDGLRNAQHRIAQNVSAKNNFVTEERHDTVANTATAELNSTSNDSNATIPTHLTASSTVPIENSEVISPGNNIRTREVNLPTKVQSEAATATEEPGNSIERMESDIIRDLQRRMQPRNLQLEPQGTLTPTKNDALYTTSAPITTEKDPLVYVPSRQFFHLHHMKTGGTSLGTVINCALRRLRQNLSPNQRLSYYSLSECNPMGYTRCMNTVNNSCRHDMAKSAVMTFCAPLSAVNSLDWSEADAITMLRDPVDRVWSMYRFQTKSCYKCRNLTEIYADIDKDSALSKAYGGVCLPQLVNHLTTNLLSNASSNMSDTDRLENALSNMRNRFSVVGLLEQHNTSVAMFEHVFPWLAETIPGSTDKCVFPHANGSPKNNRCGPNNTHWDLPSHPDAVTRQVIIEHNRLDIQLYEAAKQQFELQKSTLGWAESESQQGR
eukprot:m.20515 g.20515  ORF g.20515 m.20515 type:complete len:472 (+) comp12159_c0_seq1:153-1568(+)